MWRAATLTPHTTPRGRPPAPIEPAAEMSCTGESRKTAMSAARVEVAAIGRVRHPSKPPRGAHGNRKAFPHAAAHLLLSIPLLWTTSFPEQYKLYPTHKPNSW